MFEVSIYRTASGRQPFSKWLEGLKDRTAEARIQNRIDRLASGNFGDCKSVGGSVLELRIDHGPGYRVYLARRGKTVLLLLCGGDKRTQQRDIDRAAMYLSDYERRSFNA